MITRDGIIAKLKTIKDPEINVDIWTMGLIYDMDIKDNDGIRILMTLTTPFCPYGPAVKEQVDEAMRELGFKSVDLEITFDPPWKPSEELKVWLGLPI